MSEQAAQSGSDVPSPLMPPASERVIAPDDGRNNVPYAQLMEAWDQATHDVPYSLCARCRRELDPQVGVDGDLLTPLGYCTECGVWTAWNVVRGDGK